MGAKAARFHFVSISCSSVFPFFICSIFSFSIFLHFPFFFLTGHHQSHRAQQQQQQQQQQETESEHTPTPEDTSRAPLCTHDTHHADTEHDFVVFFSQNLSISDLRNPSRPDIPKHAFMSKGALPRENEPQEGSSTSLTTCASKRGTIEVAPTTGLDLNDSLRVRGHQRPHSCLSVA